MSLSKTDREEAVLPPQVGVVEGKPTESQEACVYEDSGQTPNMRRIMTFVALFGVVLAVLTHRYHKSSSWCWPSQTLEITTTKLDFLPHAIDTSWATYTPYFPVENYQSPPKNCKITQVNILQRHGARFPTLGASKNIISAVTKLKNVTTYTNPKLDFLKNFTYDLGTDSLIPFGATQSFEAAVVTVRRYQKLVNSKSLPFVRASSSQRVIDSATNWTAGWQYATKLLSPLSVVLPSDRNSTLKGPMCPKSGGSGAQTGVWLNTFAPPIAARLNTQAPGANLTPTDVYNILALCPFYTLFKAKLSPFCELFSIDEFQQFEYFSDLDKYYKRGYGQPLGPVQGVGYVNELLSRLIATPVQDNTQTNRTLDVSFPLNRTFYADFSHNNQMIAIYTAIGLFPQITAPDPTSPDPARNWRMRHLVPFSARMVTEKLVCAAGAGVGTVKRTRKQEYVRILVNDALQPLAFCGAGQNGLCELQAFVESQLYARNDEEGDFEKCFD